MTGTLVERPLSSSVETWSDAGAPERVPAALLPPRSGPPWRRLALLRGRLCHCGQIGHRGQRVVVDADHRDVLGHPQAGPAQRADRAQGDLVGVGVDRGRRVGEPEQVRTEQHLVTQHERARAA